ncbi:hypothetical protein ACUY2X_02605 [Corynebacterium minutissimum]
MSHIPLNGDRLLNHLEGSLRMSPAVALAQALEGIDAADDAPDGTNGAVKSEAPQRATDPSQGRGNPQRRGKQNDALLESVIAVINRRIR